MKHAFIAPTAYLGFIPKNSDFHLLLAHLLKDPVYCAFYRQKQQRGDTIIIDNGAFEFKRPLEGAEYAELIKQSGIVPSVVVAPDYPFEHHEKTIEGAYRFIDAFDQHFDKNRTQIMAVPQSRTGDWWGWLEAYSVLSDLDGIDWIGMSILGIPNAFQTVTNTTDISFNRTFATSYLLTSGKYNSFKKHHYLGCGDPREILMMRQMGVAYSNDSSTAFWHAIQGTRFDDSASGLLGGKCKIEVDFDFPFIGDEKVIQDIQHNVAWIQRCL